MPHVLKRWMLHGSREVFSEEIGGLALVIPREMSALVHTASGLVRDRAVHVLEVVSTTEYRLCKPSTLASLVRRI